MSVTADLKLRENARQGPSGSVCFCFSEFCKNTSPRCLQHFCPPLTNVKYVNSWTTTGLVPQSCNSQLSRGSTFPMHGWFCSNNNWVSASVMQLTDFKRLHLSYAWVILWLKKKVTGEKKGDRADTRSGQHLPACSEWKGQALYKASCGRCDIWSALLSGAESKSFHHQTHDCNTYKPVKEKLKTLSLISLTHKTFKSLGTCYCPTSTTNWIFV